MQATYRFSMSPNAFAAVVAAVLGATLLGGVGGFVVRGSLVDQAGYGGPTAPAARAAVCTPVPPSTYEQGGRPPVVYDAAACQAGK
jgi:hypothetical protein